MKTMTFFISLLITSISLAQNVTSSADEACKKSAKSWILDSESKKTGAKRDLINDSEIKLLGNGANLYLLTMFVTGPKTGDNTHWEVVGEFNYDSKSCKILLGRRYWAH